jgi:hypothetical protein
MFSLLFGPCFFSLSVFLHVSSYFVCFLFFPLCFSTFSLFCVVMLLVASQYHSQVFPLLWDFLLILSMQVSGYTGLYPLPGADEVSGEVVIDKLLSYMSLLMVPEQVSFILHVCVCVFFYILVLSLLYCFCFLILLVLILKSAFDIKGEVLTLFWLS